MFVIEDELHAETLGRFPSLEAAVAELKRLAALPWDEAPNRAPCTGWQTCGRNYEVVQLDTKSVPWQELQRMPALEISAGGVRWLGSFGEQAG